MFRRTNHRANMTCWKSIWKDVRDANMKHMSNRCYDSGRHYGIPNHDVISIRIIWIYDITNYELTEGWKGLKTNTSFLDYLLFSGKFFFLNFSLINYSKNWLQKEQAGNCSKLFSRYAIWKSVHVAPSAPQRIYFSLLILLYRRGPFLSRRLVSTMKEILIDF